MLVDVTIIALQLSRESNTLLFLSTVIDSILDYTFSNASLHEIHCLTFHLQDPLGTLHQK